MTPKRQRAIAVIAGGATGLLLAHLLLRGPRARSKRELKLEEEKFETTQDIRALWLAFLDTQQKIRRGEYSKGEIEKAFTDFEFARMALRNPDLHDLKD